MSALEIIEQIKALPHDQRQMVDEFVKSAASNESRDPADKTSEFEDLVDRIFDKHANLLHRLAQ